jgi:hypothetical protein
VRLDVSDERGFGRLAWGAGVAGTNRMKFKSQAISGGLKRCYRLRPGRASSQKSSAESAILAGCAKATRGPPFYEPDRQVLNREFKTGVSELGRSGGGTPAMFPVNRYRF